MIRKKRLFRIPEVVQTHAADCGPASLQCVCEGFGIPVTYARLREACRDEYDGTHLDDMGTLAKELGLDVEERFLPVDHLLLPGSGSYPAILSLGTDHLAVLWRRVGPFVQVMDPRTGRRWPSARRFRREVRLETRAVAAGAWREEAASEPFLAPLRRRLAALGAGRSAIVRQIADALGDPSWHGLARLDAAARLIEGLVASGVLRRGAKAASAVVAFARADGRAEGALHHDRAEGALHHDRRDEARLRRDGGTPIPDEYWLVRPRPEDPESLDLRGARVLAIRGPAAAAAPRRDEPQREEPAESSPSLGQVRGIFSLLAREGFLGPSLLLAGVAIETGLRFLEALLFRGLLDVGSVLAFDQRLVSLAVLIAFFAVAPLLQYLLNQGLFRLGRVFESGLRVTFLEKISRIAARYLTGHPLSDLTDRCHNVHSVRTAGYLGGKIVRAVTRSTLTAVAIAWINPRVAPIALLAVACSMVLAFRSRTALAERDLRVKTHGGGLSRFYLDALLGLVPCRTHGAERALRREHESLLVEWFRAGLAREKGAVLAEGLQLAVGTVLTLVLLLVHLSQEVEPGGVLLLLYWSLSITEQGKYLAAAMQEYASYRSRLVRFLEPLDAPEETRISSLPDTGTGYFDPRTLAPIRPQDADWFVPVRVTLEDVTVRITGHTVLAGIDLDVEAGTHMAIVGPSGAGKTTLISLLLGWEHPVAGRILVDDRELTPERLEQLRLETAWVDPSVQLWNRSFLDNLRYGAPGHGRLPIGKVIRQAELQALVEGLPDGLQTGLGEGGAFLSGGEGQRVRLGRALLRTAARLVILDEPFRGLDHEQRHLLLRRARSWWANTTLICITHDVSETRDFERVVVMEDGAIVEDDAPARLLAEPETRYRALFEAEDALRREIWADPAWRKLRLQDGHLVAAEPRETPE